MSARESRPSIHSHSVDNDSTYATSNDVIHNGEAWAEAPEADPYSPLILCLDGGGIRGYSSLLILQALMHEISIWEVKIEAEARRPSRDSKVYTNGVSQIPTIKSLREDGRRSPSRSPAPPPEPSNEPTPDFSEGSLLPCHYFDFMYGTSTGGLIATMLGRLRMSVPQCLTAYRDVGDDLFGKRRSYIPLATKYHSKPLEIAVQDIVKSHSKAKTHTDGQDWFPWDLDLGTASRAEFDTRHVCQSICLAAVSNGKIDEAHMLRTYDHQYNSIPRWTTPYNQGAANLRIWQVTRATSAAPFYFKSLSADGMIFKDGGIRENNPAGAAYSEFATLHTEGEYPAALISIGTGRPNEASNDGFAASWPGPFGRSSLLKKIAETIAVVRNVLIKYTEGERTHTEMSRTAQGEHTWYKRLNVSEGLEGLALDNWKKGPWTNPEDGTTKIVPGGATLTRMEQATDRYLKRDIDLLYDGYAAPRTKVRQIAEKLVRTRRARQAAARIPSTGTARRYDTYMGKYLTGEYKDEIDGPVFEPMRQDVVDNELPATCCSPIMRKKRKPTTTGDDHAEK